MEAKTPGISEHHIVKMLVYSVKGVHYAVGASAKGVQLGDDYSDPGGLH
jgi:hypothetical protein